MILFHEARRDNAHIARVGRLPLFKMAVVLTQIVYDFVLFWAAILKFESLPSSRIVDSVTNESELYGIVFEI